MYMLGAQLEEAYPVVPISDDHSLSVGIFSYGGGLFFGLYADPGALPQVVALPAALRGALSGLTRVTRPAPRRPRNRGASDERPAVTGGPSGRRDVWTAGHVRQRSEA
jgi:hypothetical protein